MHKNAVYCMIRPQNSRTDRTFSAFWTAPRPLSQRPVHGLPPPAVAASVPRPSDNRSARRSRLPLDGTAPPAPPDWRRRHGPPHASLSARLTPALTRYNSASLRAESRAEPATPVTETRFPANPALTPAQLSSQLQQPSPPPRPPGAK